MLTTDTAEVEKFLAGIERNKVFGKKIADAVRRVLKRRKNHVFLPNVVLRQALKNMKYPLLDTEIRALLQKFRS